MIEIQKLKNKTFQFRVKTDEGQILLESIDFESEEEIEHIIGNLTPTGKPVFEFERKTNYSGNFLFNLKDKNGRTIGSSLLYDSEAGMENGITNLRKRLSSLTRPG